ncbi:septum formation family protein [Cellulomonas sp. NPDC089187]|uniref:septum formation family protein n=1 Tax=Cellulomonas sp. NPDC089187 TaxID=3154970 RepID=UPI00341F4F5A
MCWRRRRVLVALIGLAACSSGDDSTSSSDTTASTPASASEEVEEVDEVVETAEPTDTDVMDLKVGDCMDDSIADGEEVFSAGTIPCDQPHTREIYAEMELTNVTQLADVEGSDLETFCVNEFATFVGTAYEDSILNATTLKPTTSSWAFGNRTAQCIVISDEPVTGTLAGSGL